MPIPSATPPMSTRQQEARDLRYAAADLAAGRDHPRHLNNGEEFHYRDPRADAPTFNLPTYLASFTKGLPHNPDDGLLALEPGAEDPFGLFVLGIQSGNVTDFRRTPLGPPKYTVEVGRAHHDEVTGGGGSAVDYAQVWESTMATTKPAPAGQTGDGARVRAWESAGAGHVFDLQGPDAQAVTMPPAPRLDEAELAAEIAEVYLMALLRDVPFSRFRTGAANDAAGKRVAEAASLLNEMDWFDAVLRPALDPPARDRHRAGLTRETLFRGFTAGDTRGPYLSQFLVAGTPHLGGPLDHGEGYVQYGAVRIDQRVRLATPGRDYMTTWEQWLDVQNGADLRGMESYEDAPAFRFMATPRDLATYVHYDALYEAYLNACLMLLSLGVPFDRGIPFQVADNVDRQQGFAHFGGPHILSLVTEVATRALKAVRYQKFNVHRRARPEAVCGLVHRRHAGLGDARLDAIADLVDALDAPDTKVKGKKLLAAIAAHNKTQNRADDRKDDPSAADDSFLLPMAFPEGSPMHPAYGAGHAAVAGACVTILKAYFDHGYPLTDKLGRSAWEPTDDGSALQEVSIDRPLTVEGELNKLAANIAIGRDWAGVHYYTDYIESLRMGEQVALGILEEQKLTYRENFTMTLPLFSGEVVRI